MGLHGSGKRFVALCLREAQLRRRTATTLGRGGIRSSKSGQRVRGVSNVAPLPSPGCCTARKRLRPSGVNFGPHTSAPAGALKNALPVPRRSPTVSMAQRPSAAPVSSLPSVETHRFPAGSMAQLSGLPNQPFFEVRGFHAASTEGSFGSPHLTISSQRDVVEVKSLSGSTICT